MGIGVARRRRLCQEHQVHGCGEQQSTQPVLSSVSVSAAFFGPIGMAYHRPPVPYLLQSSQSCLSGLNSTLVRDTGRRERVHHHWGAGRIEPVNRRRARDSNRGGGRSCKRGISALNYDAGYLCALQMYFSAPFDQAQVRTVAVEMGRPTTERPRLVSAF